MKGRAERERNIRIAHEVLEMVLGNKSLRIKEQEQSAKRGATTKGLRRELSEEWGTRK